MTDVLVRCYRQTLPHELLATLEPHLHNLQAAKYSDLLSLPVLKASVKQASTQHHDRPGGWTRALADALADVLAQGRLNNAVDAHLVFLVGLAALQAFLQSNVTGPPLEFAPETLVFPSAVHQDPKALLQFRQQIIADLGSDGAAAYKLTPNIELFKLALDILDNPELHKAIPISSWAFLRCAFVRQRLLSETSPSLQTDIYNLLEQVRHQLTTEPWAQGNKDVLPAFLLEEAAIHTFHGSDRLARQALDQATSARGFHFALTGLLGKRTKYQQKDLSQLVVLAKSSQDQHVGTAPQPNEHKEDAKPEDLDLNDDTLLEKISFTANPKSSVDVKDYDHLPATLQDLDANDQPILQPLDSISLLAYASSITNTSPNDGLTREETLPYATRVLEGGSSNWQVYTQALLVRSRIEGYRARTVERGLLQLQALVDQVIAETTKEESARAEKSEGSTTFLPRAKESESASANERLMYIFQLNSPTRWELEAELASRWVSMGGLRSALEIYERLQMWAEAALCWAATEREDKARAMVRRQLFHSTGDDDEAVDLDSEKWEGKERDPPPADAPRLYCILGDIDQSPGHYEKAWVVSRKRYARAQRSLGRFYLSANKFAEAAAAYKRATEASPLHHASWFALGCCWLELSDFDAAAQAFSRTVSLDDTDAEAWSNLATALLKKEPKVVEADRPPTNDEEQDILEDAKPPTLPHQHRLDALKALKRAATLKFDSFRIWDNLLTVAASTVPPSYNDIVAAQRRIIDMRGPTDGERCIDVTILDYLAKHIIDVSTTADGKSEYDASKPGLVRMVVDMIDKQVVPLITASARLWQIVARLALWRKRPGTALEAHEKAWRAVSSQPGWETGTEEQWNRIVDATVDLADAYESLGPMERTEGLAAGSGELVAKDWKFKARSALRSIQGKGKDAWQDTEGWNRLQDALEQLKG